MRTTRVVTFRTMHFTANLKLTLLLSLLPIGKYYRIFTCISTANPKMNYPFLSTDKLSQQIIFCSPLLLLVYLSFYCIIQIPIYNRPSYGIYFNTIHPFIQYKYEWKGTNFHPLDKKMYPYLKFVDDDPQINTKNKENKIN